MVSKKSICIISFSPIYRDARVLRQIKFLSSHYDLTVIGYGPPHKDWVKKNNVTWISIDTLNSQSGELNKINKLIKMIQFLQNKLPNSWLTKPIRSMVRKIKLSLSFALLCMGRVHPNIYEFWYWRGKYRLNTLQFAMESNAQAFHANDWESLPIAAKAAEFGNAKVVFDAHEYAPLELENRWYWKPLFQPAITYFLRKYSPQVNASVTVAPLISERYKKEFGFDAKVILNTPETESLPVKKSNFNNIRLVHHGGAIRDRRLENLIETVAFCDQRFSLHFLLINNDLNYLRELKTLAENRAPGKVVFHTPVFPEEIVRRITKYDIGLCLIAPTNYNYLISLPNKFFDYIAAGLAICIGPSPSMAEIVRQYGLGCVAPSFEPRHVAETLNRLTADELSKMQAASCNAAREINAEKEMKKLIDLYNQLLDGQGCITCSNDLPRQTHPQ